MQVQGVCTAPDSAVVLGVQPGVPVLGAEPSQLLHLHVSGQGRLLPLHQRGRRRHVCRPPLLLLPVQLLRPLGLHERRVSGAALPALLPACHRLRQAVPALLRPPAPAWLQVQEHKQCHVQGTAREQSQQGREALLITGEGGRGEDAPQGGGVVFFVTCVLRITRAFRLQRKQKRLFLQTEALRVIQGFGTGQHLTS